MSKHALYCFGCNEKFAAADGAPACPNCGQSLASWGEMPTVDIPELDARETYVPSFGRAEKESDQLLGRQLGIYRVEAFLGKGGMARVYRATHQTLERPCALKVLNPRLLSKNTNAVERFLMEARVAASLVHPHIVTVHSIGHDEDLHYIEMEYVAGKSLAAHVDLADLLDPTDATRLMVEISSALAAAHRRDMIHRDVKPANVLVTHDGRAKLADFGLAKRVVAADDEKGVAMLSGTPNYMAPELFHGGRPNKRSDVYAMGVTYFFLLTRQLPRLARGLAELANLQGAHPIRDVCEVRPDTPDEAAAVVRRCLLNEPERRYADADELHANLQAVYAGLRSLESLLVEALTETNVQWHRAGEQFNLVVPLENGRSQQIIVEIIESDSVASCVVRIFSVCGPAQEHYFRRALELNAQTPHGSIAIQPINGQPHFVMTNTYPRATCDPEEIRQSVLTIARCADNVENTLTGRDQY